jgi:arylsulfatase A-like enzyme
VTTADLMPTILEAAGVGLAQSATDAPRVPRLQSRSLIAELRAEDNWSRDVVLQNIPQKGIEGSYYDERAIRTERHKLILRKYEVRPSLRAGELYDLVADRSETNNLYSSQPGVVRTLANKLAEWGRTNRDELSVELGTWASGT